MSILELFGRSKCNKRSQKSVATKAVEKDKVISSDSELECDRNSKFDDRNGRVSSCGVQDYNCDLSSCEELSEGEGFCNEDQDIDEDSLR